MAPLLWASRYAIHSSSKNWPSRIISPFKIICLSVVITCLFQLMTVCLNDVDGPVGGNQTALSQLAIQHSLGGGGESRRQHHGSDALPGHRPANAR